MTKGIGRFDVAAIAASFPPEAQSLLLDHYMVDGESASARVFRVYRPTPAHFHRHSDEFLYVLSGTGLFWLEDKANAAPFAPGALLAFPRETVHAIPEMGSDPVVFLAIDAPRRRPDDIVFVEAGAGTPAGFIQPKG